jgi:hypothetical protein
MFRLHPEVEVVVLRLPLGMIHHLTNLQQMNIVSRVRDDPNELDSKSHATNVSTFIFPNSELSALIQNIIVKGACATSYQCINRIMIMIDPVYPAGCQKFKYRFCS